MKRIQCQVKYYPSSLDTFSCHLKYRWKLCFMYVCMCVNVCAWEFKYHKEKCDAVHPSILTSYIISFFWLQASPHPISFNILQYVRVLFHCTIVQLNITRSLFRMTLIFVIISFSFWIVFICLAVFFQRKYINIEW